MFSSIIAKILLAVVLALGVGNVAQYLWHGWTVKGLKQQVENLKVEKVQLETELAKKKIEVAYAPKIDPLRKIAKRRTPKQIKPVVIERQPPPKVDPQEWADAVSVAESINSYWGVRDKPSKSAPGKASDARLWPPPGRAHAQC